MAKSGKWFVPIIACYDVFVKDAEDVIAYAWVFFFIQTERANFTDAHAST